MKYFITFIFAAAVIFYSCGDDNTTNNSGTGGETVLFSMDSLSIYLTSNLASKDTNIVLNNVVNYKISFNCTTNVDSINTFAFYRITVSDSSNIFLDSLNNNHSFLNNNHNFVINNVNNSNVLLYIQISRGNSTPGYLKIYNFKIIKL